MTSVLEKGHGPSGADFAVRLDNFEGPFDLLLSLISRHKLDITEVALSQVTDEFLATVKRLGAETDLERLTSFLVVAATLLDLKTVRLLPSAELEDEEDLALLEARDLLFARLLQYRAFKQVAASLERSLASAARRVPRPGGLEERFASVLPDVLIAVGPREFASIAAAALAPRPAPVLPMSHLHAPRVSVREQARVVSDRLRRAHVATFRSLASDSPDTVTRVARFLALLELFREGLVTFEQVTPLGELSVRWIGGERDAVAVGDEYDGGTGDIPVAEATS